LYMSSIKDKLKRSTQRSGSWVRFSAKERTLFAKRLSFLVKAGVPLVDALHLIRSQTRSRGQGRVYDAVIADVTSGQYLATSLDKFKQHFGEFSINLIRVGEHSGVLSQNLAYLADELQRRNELTRKVRGAMIYPIFITVVTLLVTAMLTVFIFPKLMPLFVSLHVELPLTTRIMLATSQYLQNWGLETVGGLVLAGFLFAWLRGRFEWLRYNTDRVVIALPIAGTLARVYNLANFSRTLGLLLKSSLYVNDALGIVAQTTPNRVYRSAYEALRVGVQKGEGVSKGLAQYTQLFPEMMTHMVAVGEGTGNLSASLMYLSELYESEVEGLTKGLSSSIEPVLMIVMGMLVGLIAVSVITPIYEITQHLQPK